jgi:hypothetical protein
VADETGDKDGKVMDAAIHGKEDKRKKSKRKQ